MLMCISHIALNDNAFYVAALVKPLFTYFFPCILWALGHLVQSRLAASVDTQLWPYPSPSTRASSDAIHTA